MKVALAKQSGKEGVSSFLLSEWVRTYDRSKSILSRPIDFI
jgi:hypothetical protein